MMKRLLYVLMVIAALHSLAGCKKREKHAAAVACGGMVNFVCTSEMYCHLKGNCGGLDLEGVCEPRPTECPNENSPVCGCDDKTYSSACYAMARGVTVRSTGRCDTGEGAASEDEPGGKFEEESGENQTGESVP